MTKLNIFVLCFVYLVVVVFAQPKISETYEAHVTFTIKDAKYGPAPYNGRGVLAADQAKGYDLEVNTFEDHHSMYEVYRLDRYDLKSAYKLDNENRTSCDKSELSGNAPFVWTWLSLSTFGGKFLFYNRTLEWWILDHGYATLELAVDPLKPNIPVIQRRNSSASSVTTFYETFTTTPSDSLFAVPTACKSAQLPKVPLACRARNDMIEVGNAWVSAKVPYDQGGRHDGYREDCSGFVSAAWELSKPGPVTQDFHDYAKQIAKDSLLPGDCLLFAAEHVVLFGGWVDSAKTQYTAYEETKPGEGMVKRATPYPYWYSQSSFIPHRYNSVC